jgi:hypothetical protein
MAQDRDIKYINKDFTDFRSQLAEYAKNYFPNTYNDFSATSPGAMFIEMAAYVGDVLSFYQDMQLQETYIQYAKNPANLYNMAYMMGYRPKTTTAAEVDIEVSQLVNALGDGEPNWNQALQIGAGVQLSSTVNGQARFYIDKPIDFTFSSSYDPTEVFVETLDINGEPDEFLLTKTVKAFSGEVKTVSQTFDTVQKFTTVTISDTNIIGILSVIDNNGLGNVWYEVPFLGQDTIFTDEENTSSDSDRVPYVLQLRKVPRRFTTRFNSNGELILQFGAGITGQDDSVLTPDPTNVGLGNSQGISRIDYAYDPSNFLYSQAYGLAPLGTLQIRYLVGGGAGANVPANTITNVISPGVITGTDTSKQSSLTYNNPEAATGGKDGDTVEEIRQNSLRAFNEQGRAVTLQDYTVRALSLPSKYGSIGKVYITQDQLTNPNSATDSIIDSNPLSLSLYTLAYDNNRNLQTSTQNLKNNLKTYLSEYMLLTDAINIKDAFVINIAVNYDIILRPNYLGRDVLLECNNILIDYFDIRKWNINQPIDISSLYTVLDKVKGVQTVQRVSISNLAGGDYSIYGYDIPGATRNNVVYPSYDPMIFEVKFPQEDIKGRITTL